MSPPNQTPQPDDAQDGYREQKLGEGGLKELDAGLKHVTLETERLAPVDAVKGHEAKVGHEGLSPQNDAGKALPNENGDVMQENGEEPRETQPRGLPSAGSEQNQAPQSSPAGAETMTDPTPRAEASARSSTPPPEPTAKAAGKAPVRSPSPPPPPPKDEKYLTTSNVPSRTTSPVSQGKSSGRNSEDAEAAEYAAKYDGGDDVGNDSQSEIQSIMEQFEHGAGGPGADEIMSPRLEMASPLLESPTTHPPRRSSLIPLDKPLPTPTEESMPDQTMRSPPLRTSSLYRVGTNTSLNEAMSPSAHAPQYQKPAPPPDPEPDLPFDFHRFLEQLRHRTADPVAKFLRSFLLEFGKKQWMVHEQVKIIGDFLEFISKKMGQCEVWRTVSDAEFDNAREGMEKLVMNRLYSQTFSPAIPPPEPIPHTKGRRRHEAPGPGRRGQHQEDVERDEVLAQKVRIYKWIREEHLDIKPVDAKGKKFLQLAQQELLKIKSYRAPRDKVICILNCCKVIFGYLRTASSDMSADAFVPLLIYTVLQANPDHLVSNVQYILRFRNQDKLGGEAGYYISSLMGAIQFIEGLDRTSLTVSDAEFEQNVEAAVSAIAERHADPDPDPNPDPTSTSGSASITTSTTSTTTTSAAAQPHLRLQTHAPASPAHRRMPSPHSLHLDQKSSLSRPEVTPRNSLEAEKAGPHRTASFRASKSDPDAPGPAPDEENAAVAVAGLLRTIQKPLSTIGRIFSDNDAAHSTATAPNSASAPPPAPAPRGIAQLAARSPRRGADVVPGSGAEASREGPELVLEEKQPPPPPRRSVEEAGNERGARARLSAEDAAALQASVEEEQARRAVQKEHEVKVETLAGMFPQLDRDVIDDVVRGKEGRVGLAVDACLALANP